MIRYQLSFNISAYKDLACLQKHVAKRIIDKLDFFAESANPLRYAKPLTNNSIGSYRFRIGDYRAIFDVDKKGRIHILMILRVKHRKDIYGL